MAYLICLREPNVRECVEEEESKWRAACCRYDVDHHPGAADLQLLQEHHGAQRHQQDHDDAQLGDALFPHRHGGTPPTDEHLQLLVDRGTRCRRQCTHLLSTASGRFTLMSEQRIAYRVSRRRFYESVQAMPTYRSYFD